MRIICIYYMPHTCIRDFARYVARTITYHHVRPRIWPNPETTYHHVPPRTTTDREIFLGRFRDGRVIFMTGRSVLRDEKWPPKKMKQKSGFFLSNLVVFLWKKNPDDKKLIFLSKNTIFRRIWGGFGYYILYEKLRTITYHHVPPRTKPRTITYRRKLFYHVPGEIPAWIHSFPFLFAR